MNSAARTKLPAQSEASFQRQVEELAFHKKWRSYHTRYSIKSVAGFPDEVFIRPPRVLFVELKAEGKNPTNAQWDWIKLLLDCPGVETYVWRPSDWDEIVRILE